MFRIVLVSILLGAQIILSESLFAGNLTGISNSVSPPVSPVIAYYNKPVNLQLYPRDSIDQASVIISGQLQTPGFDSVYFELYRNNQLVNRISQHLQYNGNNSEFYLERKIYAELAEWKVKFYTVYQTTSTLVLQVDSIACGDIYIIGGQSNGQNPNDTMSYTDEYCRVFGVQTDVMNFDQYVPGDTVWHRASAKYHDFSIGGSTTQDAPYNVGVLGLQLQRYIRDSCRVPTAIINATIWGTSISMHTKASEMTDFVNYYGKTMYRMNRKSGGNLKVKAIIWYQGEIDVNSAMGNINGQNSKGVCGYASYKNKFDSLYFSWHDDFPDLEKIFVMQIRPLSCAGTSDYAQELREVQRQLQYSYSDVQLISTNGIGGYTNCHYSMKGYIQLAQVMFKNFAVSFYPSTNPGRVDTTNSRPPNIRKAFFTNPSRTQIGISFDQSKPAMIPADSLGNSVRQYFYVNKTRLTKGNVSSVTLSADKDTMFINLTSAASGSKLSYLPDYIDSSGKIYNGPWIRNARGLAMLSFDNVNIDDPPDLSKDAGVNYASCNNHGRIIAGENLTFNASIKNFGLYDLSSVPVSFSANGEVITDTIMGNLNAGESADIQFGFTAFAPGDYVFKIFTTLTGDINHSNDTLKMELAIVDSSRDAGISPPDVAHGDSIQTGEIAVFNVYIKNFGEDAISNFTAGFFINGVLVSENDISSVLEPGDSVKSLFKYVFRNKGIYDCRFITLLDNDEDRSNDTASLKIIAAGLSEARLEISLIPEGLYIRSMDRLIVQDTVRSYLHRSVFPFEIIDSSAAVVDEVSFKGIFVFTNTTEGEYYLSIRHKNSLETWSRLPLGLYGDEPITASYDFIHDSSMALGSNLVRVEESPIRYAIYSGDVNHDGGIDLTDLIRVFNDAFSFESGYMMTDLTGDNFVDLSDLLIAFVNANKFVVRVTP